MRVKACGTLRLYPAATHFSPRGHFKLFYMERALKENNQYVMILNNSLQGV
jgi:hypothetical protein